jgi:hypothetical protein
VTVDSVGEPVGQVGIDRGEFGVARGDQLPEADEAGRSMLTSRPALISTAQFAEAQAILTVRAT